MSISKRVRMTSAINGGGEVMPDTPPTPPTYSRTPEQFAERQRNTEASIRVALNEAKAECEAEGKVWRELLGRRDAANVHLIKSGVCPMLIPSVADALAAESLTLGDDFELGLSFVVEAILCKHFGFAQPKDNPVVL